MTYLNRRRKDGHRKKIMKTIKRPTFRQMQDACNKFNATCPVGGKVLVELDNVAEPFATVTTSEAQILSGHTAVVWMEGVRGCYLLDRVTPVGATS